MPLKGSPMRALCLVALLLPGVARADDVTLYAVPTAVTVFPGGALVERDLPFDLPAGTHRLILGGLPELDARAFDVAVEGAEVLGATFRQARVEVPDDALPLAVRAAKERVQALEADLAEAEDRVAGLRAGAEAAEAEIDFLKALGRSAGAPALPLDDLRALAGMVGTETGAARAAAIAAEAEARAADVALADLRRQLRAAVAEYNLLRGPEETAQLVVSLQAEGGAGHVTVTNYADASWQPVYDFRLDTDAGAVVVDRSVMVQQSSGENWTDVALTLSTDQPGQALGASDQFYNRRRIEDPVSALASARVEAAPMAEPIMLADAAGAMKASYDGLAVTYDVPQPVTILRQADRALFRLDGFRVDADIFAAAIPQNDPTAYVTAALANELDEILLPSDMARFHVDGRFVGDAWFPGLVPGEETELGFGPIAGLQLERTVLNRAEGDRGVINRSNQADEEVLIEVKNLTPRAWPVRLRDAVPYSEQEDLRITWAATPSPDAEDIDNRRGVLQWNLQVAPGETKEIRIEQRLAWPDGKVLR